MRTIEFRNDYSPDELAKKLLDAGFSGDTRIDTIAAGLVNHEAFDGTDETIEMECVVDEDDVLEALGDKAIVDAAVTAGARPGRVLFLHLLPNAMTPVIVAGMLATGDAIVLEATLGFFGLGAQPPVPSWGAMMSSGTAQIFIAPWIIIFPGLVIATTVIAINLFGDALIEALDIRRPLRDG